MSLSDRQFAMQTRIQRPVSLFRHNLRKGGRDEKAPRDFSLRDPGALCVCEQVVHPKGGAKRRTNGRNAHFIQGICEGECPKSKTTVVLEVVAVPRKDVFVRGNVSSMSLV